jgi:hypothetical protein
VDIPLLTAEKRWSCPNCDHTDVTRQAAPHTRFHHCPKYGITAPMVEAGTRCKVEALEREDYVGDEDVRLNDEGRPIMSMVTTRDDGTDCAVFAPTAHLSLRS